MISARVEEEVTYLDPPNCGCTACLTGESEPMSESEYEQFGFRRIKRTTTMILKYEEED